MFYALRKQIVGHVLLGRPPDYPRPGGRRPVGEGQRLDRGVRVSLATDKIFSRTADRLSKKSRLTSGATGLSSKGSRKGCR